ncbi:unnamed protein product [Lepeophtheirus salmonis]|uniref:(salmon louse) hypothetical protein n=1 Tax=Lepeophtheirus salmonis TaxID=72036 RepID=A0A7R8CN45_LEPSM|nr:unnamed protein product [Lepeophtheirus salmonis]CAF2872074.1 unnamed protein product [Lepeophtheirus salmonis]
MEVLIHSMKIINKSEFVPERFDVDPSSSEEDHEWKHWIKTFTCFVNKVITAVSEPTSPKALKLLSRDCEFKAVSAEESQNNFLRDPFINGISSPHIRQQLLENDTLDWNKSFTTPIINAIIEKDEEVFGHKVEAAVMESLCNSTIVWRTRENGVSKKKFPPAPQNLEVDTSNENNETESDPSPTPVTEDLREVGSRN